MSHLLVVVILLSHRWLSGLPLCILVDRGIDNLYMDYGNPWGGSNLGAAKASLVPNMLDI
jgi:hypothetical protein